MSFSRVSPLEMAPLVLPNKELGPVLEPEEDLAVFQLFSGNRGPQLWREAGFPCLAILRAKALSAGGLFLGQPRGDVNEECLTPEPFTMQRTFHQGSNRLLVG